MSQTQPPMGGKQLLLDKNSKLSAQISSQRQEINDLRDKLRNLEETEIKWHETAACISSIWDELNQSIAFLQFKIHKEEKEEASSDENMTGLEGANPFLSHLLKRYLPDDPVAKKSAVSLAENISLTEEALRKKMQDSMKAAASVLQSIEDMKNASTETSLSGEEETKLKALIHVLRAENGKLLTDSLQDSVALKKLESDVADKEAQILTMHRKLALVREGTSQQLDAGPAEPMKQEMSRPSSTQNIASTDADTAKLQAEVNARTREVEQRDKAIVKLESELYEMKRRMDSEAAQVKLAVAERQEKLDVVSKDLERVNQKLRDAYREQDRLNGKLRDISRDFDRGSRAMRRETRLESALVKLEGDVKRLRSERNAAEAKLVTLEQGTGSETRSEILHQMKGMESEIKMLKEALKKHQTAAEEVEEAQKLKASHHADISEYKSKIEYVRSQMDLACSKLNHWIEKYVEQVKINEEIRWLLEMTQKHNGTSDKVTKELKEEIQKYVKKEMASLDKNLSDAVQSKTTEAEEACAKKLAAAEEELKGAQGKQASLAADLEKITQENASLKEEVDVFWKEMDTVSEAYEASREQNTKLLEAMSKRDEDNARLLSEAAAASRDKAVMEEERDYAETRYKNLEKDSQEWKKRVETSEVDLEKALKDRDSYKVDVQQLSEQVASLSTEIKTMGITADSLRSELTASKNEISAVEADKAKHLLALKTEKTRADRAEAVLSGRKDLKTLAGEDAEREALRKMVNCNVCSTRLKDRIITKCNHLFCSACIDANLSSRNRKCPGCGEKFGQADVKPFYFT